MRIFLILTLILQLACTTSIAQKVQRVPLEKSKVVIQSPPQGAERVLRYDTKTGEPIYYNPKPQVVVVDEKAGKYAFKWIGHDGKEKVIEYQRADAIDVIVSATVSKTQQGQYLYTYHVQNLPSSGSRLTIFIPQNFASDVKPTPVNDDYVGPMSNAILEFSKGNWIAFHTSSLEPSITPGRSIEFQLTSAAPPGMVECRAHGGEITLEGVGEDMPTELENIMPGYEMLPKGYTIGPMDLLTSTPVAERARQINSWLPTFRKIGWMTDGSLRWYEQHLKDNDLKEILGQAEKDLKSEQITSEVFAIIQSLAEQPKQ